MFVVGLDLSLRSSGCVIFDTNKNTWHLCAFAHNESQIGCFQIRENVFVSIFPPVPSARQAESIQRYVHVQTYLVRQICTIISKEHRSTTNVVVEDYCAQSNQRRSGVRQHESGGSVKCSLYRSGFTNIVLVPNKKWKGGTMQKGNASKLDTVHFISQNGPKLDLLKLFGYQETSLKLVNGIAQVPTPVQDLADASAICLYAYYLTQNTIKKPMSKPKITIVQSPEVQAELRTRLEIKKKARRTSVWANTEPKTMVAVKRSKRRRVQTP